MATEAWKASLTEFFAQRATQTGLSKPCLENLCYVSGRDARLWSQAAIYDDLISSISECIRGDLCSSVLEVGCASGFLAYGMAPKVGRYVGIDIAAPALEVARKLGLSNAKFQLSDGECLPFSANQFDGAYCYDVFTNFPAFQNGEAIIREMLRVVKPGGKVLVGSIPDAALQMEFEEKAREVSAELEASFGLLPVRREGEAHAPSPAWWRRLLARGMPSVKPEIICYYFNQRDFETLGQEMDVPCDIRQIHALNPYVGYRFNVLYTKL